MKQVLVTGATGFVGRHVVELLLTRGYRVRAAVRTHASSRLLPTAVHSVPVGDIEDADWSRVLDGTDFIVHLAAHAHRAGERDASLYDRVNVRGTARLTAAALAAGVPRVVFVSSVKAAGEGRGTYDQPYKESDACSPVDAYGRSKREAELVLEEAATTGRLRATVLRPPMVYGPGVKANFLSLFRAVDRGIPLPLASVRNRRSLLFVRNLAGAIVRCLREGESRDAFELFFVADEESVSTPELVQRMARHLERSPRLVPFPVALLRHAARVLGKQGAVDRLTGSLVVDTSRVKAILGWTPPFSLDEGLAETTAWYRAMDASHHTAGPKRSLKGVGRS